MKLRITFTINRDNAAGINHGNVEQHISGARPVEGKHGQFYVELDEIPLLLPSVIVANTTITEFILTDRAAISSAKPGRYVNGGYEAEVTACAERTRRNIRIGQISDLEILRGLHKQLLAGLLKPTKPYATA